MTTNREIADAFYAASKAAMPTTYGGAPMMPQQQTSMDSDFSSTLYPYDENKRAQELADESTARTLRRIGDVYSKLAAAETETPPPAPMTETSGG